MNGPDRNQAADFERRYPDATALIHRWARQVKTRKFVYITDANDIAIAVRDQDHKFPEPPEIGNVRELSHKQFVELYNMVPLKRMAEAMR